MNDLTERTREHFARRWTTYAKAFTATCLALGIIGGAAQALGLMPVTQRQFDVVANDQASVIYILLNERAKQGTLDPFEHQKYCEAARKLGLQGHGCA